MFLLRRQGTAQASEYIMNKYKNLVRSKAHAYFIMGAEAEDLLQEGMIGLFKAIRDYDKEKNDSFLCLCRYVHQAALFPRLRGRPGKSIFRLIPMFR